MPLFQKNLVQKSIIKQILVFCFTSDGMTGRNVENCGSRMYGKTRPSAITKISIAKPDFKRDKLVSLSVHVIQNVEIGEFSQTSQRSKSVQKISISTLLSPSLSFFMGK